MTQDFELYKGIIRAYAQGWSNRDVDAVLSLTIDDVYFEDVPLELIGRNKKQFGELLTLAFNIVPDFRMELIRINVGPRSAAFLWNQSGTATHDEAHQVGEYNVDGPAAENFQYSVLTTTMMEFTEDNKISWICDNWNRAGFPAEPSEP